MTWISNLYYMLQELIRLLRQINRKLDLLITEADFSREDASVRKTTAEVVAAKDRIPGTQQKGDQ